MNGRRKLWTNQGANIDIIQTWSLWIFLPLIAVPFLVGKSQILQKNSAFADPPHPPPHWSLTSYVNSPNCYCYFFSFILLGLLFKLFSSKCFLLHMYCLTICKGPIKCIFSLKLWKICQKWHFLALYDPTLVKHAQKWLFGAKI